VSNDGEQDWPAKMRVAHLEFYKGIPSSNEIQSGKLNYYIISIFSIAAVLRVALPRLK
jgi:hypothetical protein